MAGQRWRERYGPIVGLFLGLWLALQWARDLMLLPSDLRQMSEMVAGWGSLEVPAFLVRWVLEFVAVGVVAVLLAPALSSGVVGLFGWSRKQISARRRIPMLFGRLSPGEMATFRELLGGPKVITQSNNPNILTKSYIVICDLDATEDKEYRHTGTGRLCRIKRGYRLTFSRLIRSYDRKQARERKARAKAEAKRLDRSERRLLWLFWQGELTEIHETALLRALGGFPRHETARSLQRKELLELEWKSGWLHALRLPRHAKKIIEKYVFRGKAVGRTEILVPRSIGATPERQPELLEMEREIERRNRARGMERLR